MAAAEVCSDPNGEALVAASAPALDDKQEEGRAVQVARAFFEAATRLSEDNEDILPQEDSSELKLSVYYLFSELFPEFSHDKDKDPSGKGGLMRLQFNKIGYEIYEKEQSRRVPAVRAKPGNPGYGFRRARWRNTMEGEDQKVCETVLQGLGMPQDRIERIKKRVNDLRLQWDAVRRPSRPAGPGRPRGHKRRSAVEAEVCPPPFAAAVVFTAAPAAAEVQQRKPKKPRKSKAPTEAVVSGRDSAQSDESTTVGSGSHKPPKGALSPEDCALPPSMACLDVIRPPNGAPTQSSGADDKLVLGDSGEEMLWESMEPDQDHEGQYRMDSMVQENSSLRSLNMSLIYEREKLLQELRNQESEMEKLKGSVDRLFVHAKDSAPNGRELSAAFQLMSERVIGEGAARNDLPQHAKALLEKAFDRFDDHMQHTLVKSSIRTLSGPRNGESVQRPPLSSAGLRHLLCGGTHQADPRRPQVKDASSAAGAHVHEGVMRPGGGSAAGRERPSAVLSGIGGLADAELRGGSDALVLGPHKDSDVFDCGGCREDLVDLHLLRDDEGIFGTLRGGCVMASEDFVSFADGIDDTAVPFGEARTRGV